MKHRTMLAAALWAIAVAAQSVSAQIPPATTAPEISGTANPPSVPAGQTAKLAPGQAIPAATLETFVDGAVLRAMEAEHIAGVSVAVVQNGRVQLVKGYGLAGVDPARPVDGKQTLFRIGSLAKTFTWILLMREVERGRVKLGDPINNYLPPKLQIPDQGFAKPIRVVDLLSHTAGFEDTGLGHLILKDPAKVRSLDDYLVEHRPDRVRAPGQFSTYSNYGAALAGAIVSHLNGIDFDTLVERDIIKPLGLSHTSFREPYPARTGVPAPMPSAMAGGLSDGFKWTGAYFKAADPEYITSIGPAGSASASAGDMARYMLALLGDGKLDGATLYGPAIARAFRTPIMKTPDGVNGWAAGFMITELPGGMKAYGHGGATLYFKTYMTLVPALNLGVFVSTNTPTGRPLVEQLPHHLINSFYVEGTPSYAVPEKGAIKDPDNYTGPYVTTRRAYSGLEKFVSLVTSASSVSISPDGYLLTNMGGFVQAWAPTGDPGRFRSPRGDAALTFELDSSGRALGFMESHGSMRLERAGPLMNIRLLGAVALASLIVALWMVPTRFKRLRSKPYQARDAKIVDAVSLVAAVLWCAAFAAALLWGATLDPDKLTFDFPGGLLLTTSILALLATAASASLLMLLPLVWRDRRDWTVWRASQHSSAIVLLVTFSIFLAAWGLLEPWA